MRRRSILLVLIVFVVLSGPLEALVARHVSADYQYRLTILLNLLLGTGLTAYAYLRRRSAFTAALMAAWPILLFVSFAMASTLWSILPQSTFLAATAQIFFTLAIITTVSLINWRELLVGIALGATVIGLLSVLLIPLGGLMTDVHEGALRGPFSEKNRAGMVYAIGAVTALALTFEMRRMFWLILLPFFLGLLYLSQAGTSIIATGVALSTLAFCELLKDRPKRLILGSWAGTLIAAGIGVLIVSNAEALLDLVGEDATFTGRDRIWPAVLSRIQDVIWLGYGYDAFFRAQNVGVEWLWYEVNFEVYNAHNGWLETGLSLGIIGVALLLIAVLRALAHGFIGLSGRGDARRFLVPMMVLVLILSLTESAIGGPEGPAWLLFLMLSIKAGTRAPQTLVQKRLRPAPTW
ncbi:MAG: O-antigen ligase family protein [Pseudomonadota bacterium]